MECAACGQDNPQGSRFCNRCGSAVEQPADATAFLKQRQAAVTELRNLAAAFVQREDAPPYDRASSLAALLVGQAFGRVVSGDPLTPVARSGISYDAPDPKPTSLDSGIVATADLVVPVSAYFAQVIGAWVDVESRYLDGLVQQERERSERLLADGPKITRQRAYQDAEVHWESFQQGDLEAATAGFEHLCDLAPLDPYFHEVLGEIHAAAGRWDDALRQAVYARWLAPDSPTAATNLCKYLVLMGLAPVAMYLARDIVRRFDGREEQHVAYARRIDEVARHETTCAVNLALATRREEIDGQVVRTDFGLHEPDNDWLVGAPPEEPAPSSFAGLSAFVSYRRSDSEAFVLELRRLLKGRIPALEVFVDQEELRGGAEWTEGLRSALDGASWVLAVIGPGWLSHRIADPSDVLRRELVRALKGDCTVIPVLADGARMPGPDELPDELKPLSSRQAVAISVADPGPGLFDLQIAMEHSMPRPLPDLDSLSEEQIQSAIQELPRYVAVTLGADEGVPWHRFPTHGVWELSMKDQAGKVATMRLEILDEPGVPFRGTGEGPPARLFGGRERYTYDGTWALLVDHDRKRVGGLYLEGVRDGHHPFVVQVPMHKRLGDGYSGVDAQGISWFSKNVEPRRL